MLWDKTHFLCKTSDCLRAHKNGYNCKFVGSNKYYICKSSLGGWLHSTLCWRRHLLVCAKIKYCCLIFVFFIHRELSYSFCLRENEVVWHTILPCRNWHESRVTHINSDRRQVRVCPLILRGEQPRKSKISYLFYFVSLWIAEVDKKRKVFREEVGVTGN